MLEGPKLLGASLAVEALLRPYDDSCVERLEGATTSVSLAARMGSLTSHTLCLLPTLNSRSSFVMESQSKERVMREREGERVCVCVSVHHRIFLGWARVLSSFDDPHL